MNCKAKHRIDEQALTVDTTVGAEIPPDDALRGMQFLLDAKSVASRMSDFLSDILGRILSCEIVYVRYKPCTNCIAGYRVRFVSSEDVEETMLCYGKTVCDREFDDVCAKVRVKQWHSPDSSPGVYVIPEHNAVIYRFPNDAILHGPRALDTPKRIQRLLYQRLTPYTEKTWRISDSRLTIEVASYKPERRLVVRIRTRATERSSGRREPLALYCRFYSDSRGASVFRLLQELTRERSESNYSDSKCVSLPQPICYLPERKALLLHEIPGIALSEQQADAQYMEYIVLTARALAGIHSSAAPAYAHLPVFSAESFLQSMSQELAATATSLVTLLPDSQSLIHTLQEELLHRLPYALNSPTLVHGDFHAGQVICQSDCVGIIDFDRAQVAPRVSDIANFIAHIRRNVITDSALDTTTINTATIQRTLVTEYQKESGQTIDEDELSCWIACRLFVLAVSPFRTFEHGWRESILALLEQVRSELQ